MTFRTDPPRLRLLRDELPHGLDQALKESAASDMPTPAELLELERGLGQLLVPAKGATSPAGNVPMGSKISALMQTGWAKVALVVIPIALGTALAVFWSAHRSVPVSAPPAAAAGSDVLPEGPLTGSVAGDKLGAFVESPIRPSSTDAGSENVQDSLSKRERPRPANPAVSNAGKKSVQAGDPSAMDGRVAGSGEIELLEHARRVMASNPAVAEALVREHEQRFPNGMFVEEREAIGVEALAHAGALEQARARAARFSSRFPGSAYERRIASALESAAKARKVIP